MDDPVSATPTTACRAAQTPCTSLSKKRPRSELHSGDDPLPTPKRPKTAKSRKKLRSGGEKDKGKETAVFDTFPEDDALFGCSQDGGVESQVLAAGPSAGAGARPSSEAAAGSSIGDSQVPKL